jgi:hypothetical protein
MKSCTKLSHQATKVITKYAHPSKNWKKKCNEWAQMNGSDQNLQSLSIDSLLRNGITMDVHIAIKSLKVWVTARIAISTSRRQSATLSWELKSLMPVGQCGLSPTMILLKKYSESPTKLKSLITCWHLSLIN